VKAGISRSVAALGLALSGSACQSAAPSAELQTARDVYLKAQGSRAAEVAPADLREAERAWKAAEAAHKAAPRSNKERNYAYLAVRKAQLALAKVDADRARTEQLHAAQVLGALPYAELLRETRSELLERERALQESERALAAADEAREQLTLEQSGDEGQLRVSGVLFETESAELSPEAREQLDVLADDLLAHEDQVLVLRGYADARGPQRYNQTLSRARAQAVREYLLQRGVPAQRLRAQAIGERLPVARNDTSSGRANNRRVEIVATPASGAPADDTAPSARRRQQRERQGTDQERQNVSGKDEPGAGEH